MLTPTPLQFLIASRYTLLLWLGLAAYGWFSLGGDWDAMTQELQIVVVVIAVFFALVWLKSIPTVFFYERERALMKKAHTSPEERWRRSAIRQTFALVAIAVALIYLGWQWWHEPAPDTQNASYKAAAAGASGISLLSATVYSKAKSLFTTKPKSNQPVYVTCPLPLPNSAAGTMELPEYCKSLLTKKVTP